MFRGTEQMQHMHQVPLSVPPMGSYVVSRGLLGLHAV